MKLIKTTVFSRRVKKIPKNIKRLSLSNNESKNKTLIHLNSLEGNRFYINKKLILEILTVFFVIVIILPLVY